VSYVWFHNEEILIQYLPLCSPLFGVLFHRYMNVDTASAQKRDRRFKLRSTVRVLLVATPTNRFATPFDEGEYRTNETVSSGNVSDNIESCSTGSGDTMQE